MPSLPNTSSLIDRSLPLLPTSSSLPNMSSFPLPQDLNPDTSPIPAPLTEAKSFEKDDLEFRTITTLLGTLGTRDPITVENFQVNSQQRPSLKLLTALSSLLVRNFEMIAVMPKRSVQGTTLFVGSAAENPTEKDFRDVKSTSSAGSSSSNENLITRNPEYKDPVGPVELLNSPITHFDSDIFAFILQNWDQSFEHHVQSFAYLLNQALANPDDDQVQQALDIYCFFQSTPKTCRRFRSTYSPRLNQLLVLEPRLNEALVPSPEDLVQIRAMLRANDCATSQSVLKTFLKHPPVDPQEWLPEFHRFFVCFLLILIGEIKRLTKLRDSKVIPLDLPRSQIKHAYNNLGLLQYFSWQSPFFAHYISAVFAPGIRDPHDIATNLAGVRLSSDLGETVQLGSTPGTSEKEPETEERDELDISTEYETSEPPASVTTPWDDPHPCILELRLISSNIQNLDRLIVRTPRSRFRFQVIQYAPAGRSLMPWRDLIEVLFPELEHRKAILHALANTPGDDSSYFRPGGEVLEFKGQAHCEAVLGCLFSLAKRGEDNTWTGIPQSILHEIGTCYSLLAPSKRCCPVCAIIISFLSEEAVEAGSTGIHALSKHSIIFPCALPVGLPSSVRRKLLDKYRYELRGRLDAFPKVQQRSSSAKSAKSAKSTKSATLSLDGDSEVKPTKNQIRVLRIYQLKWPALNDEERQEEWETASQELTVGQLKAWWAEMSEEMKKGLSPPGQMEKPVLVPETANSE